MNETTANLGEATYTHTYEAPRELIFRCMVEPEHLTHFWGPVGCTTPLETITVEPRVGGVFEWTMVDDETGEEYATRATYLEFDEPRRLVWKEPEVEGGMVTTLTFTDLGNGRTEVVTHQTNIPEQWRTTEASEGMVSAQQRFAAYLTTLTS